MQSNRTSHAGMFIGDYLRLFAVFSAAAFLDSNRALADSPATQAPASGMGWLFVAIAIAYFSKRRAIGGWLLYYLVQLYFGLILSLIFISLGVANLNPSKWDSAFLYVLFLISTVPVWITELLQVFAATKLLRSRNERNLRFLRQVQIGFFVACAVSLGIDAAYFSDPGTIALDVMSTVFGCIWILYFWKAKRVRLVFVDKAWVFEPDSPAIPHTPKEKMYLLKRSVVLSVASFIVVLLVVGADIGDKSPDAGIFLAPIAYALVFFILGWMLPIGKKKRDALSNTQLTNAGK